MKVAIPYEAGQVFGHFGHSAAFMVYEIEAGKVVSSTLLPTNGISLPFFSYGGTALSIQLAEMGVVLSVSRQMKPTKSG